MSAKLTKGDLLIVRPADEDDPEAQARKGQTCLFIQQGMTGLVRVEFENGKTMWFRRQDLVHYQAELETMS